MGRFLLTLFFAACVLQGWSQVSVYARFINYSSQVLTTDGGSVNGSLITTTNIDPTSKEFFRLTTFTEGATQILNIGGQTTGAGAGKITFSPLTFSRPVDGASPIFFQMLASGTPFRTMEVFFTDASGNISSKQLYKLAAFKTVNWVAASCINDCPLVIENVSIEYGGAIVFVYMSGGLKLSTPIIKGWNAVKNVSDIDPNAIIN